MRNACGLSWLNSYLESLRDEDKSKVIDNEIRGVFRPLLVESSVIVQHVHL